MSNNQIAKFDQTIKLEVQILLRHNSRNENKDQGSTNGPGALVGKISSMSRANYITFTLIAGKGDAPNCITENIITL
jgi:hypothetical protein